MLNINSSTFIFKNKKKIPENEFNTCYVEKEFVHKNPLQVFFCLLYIFVTLRCLVKISRYLPDPFKKKYFNSLFKICLNVKNNNILG